MGHNAYIRPLGVWNANQIITHGELSAFDLGIFQSINGDLGGTWAPATPITIGGLGLNVAGAFVVQHAATIGTTDSDTLTVNSSVLFHGFCEFLGIELSEDASLHGNVLIGDSASQILTVNAVANFHGGVFCNQNSTFADCVLSLAGTAAIALASGTQLAIGAGASVACQGDMTFAGSGTTVRRNVIGSDSDSTYSISTADLVYIPQGGITAARNYFIDEVGAVNGKTIRFYREDNDASHPVTLKRSIDNSVIGILNWDSSGSVWYDVSRIAGVWRRTGLHFHA